MYWVSTRLYKKKMKRRKAKKENQKLFGGVCFIRPVHSARNVCTRFPSFCQIEGDSPPIEGREFVLYQGLSPITCLLFFIFFFFLSPLFIDMDHGPQRRAIVSRTAPKRGDLYGCIVNQRVVHSQMLRDHSARFLSHLNELKVLRQKGNFT